MDQTEWRNFAKFEGPQSLRYRDLQGNVGFRPQNEGFSKTYQSLAQQASKSFVKSQFRAINYSIHQQNWNEFYRES